jgi:NAD+-dependent farnesol dehydrogenase
VRVFLTGSTGYLGGELLRQLTADGHEIRALARFPRDLVPSRQLEICIGDLSDGNRLAEQMHGCQVVFHSAATVASWLKDEQEFYRTNHQGLLNIMAAFEKAGARTLVYTSSFFALGSAELPGLTEDCGQSELRLHPYQHSKLLARQEARKARAGGFPIVILYPGVIYGPGRTTQGNLVARLIADFMVGKVPGLLGSGRQVWSYAYIEDVARGHLCAVERAASGGEFVLGGDNVKLEDFFLTLARLVARRALRLHIPAPIAALAAAIELCVARFQGRMPQMTPATARMMCDSWACDSTKARRELGYRIRPLEEGLRETLKSMNIPTADCGLRIAD